MSSFFFYKCKQTQNTEKLLISQRDPLGVWGWIPTNTEVIGVWGFIPTNTEGHKETLHKPNRCTEHTSCVGVWAGYPQTQKDTKKLWVWEWIPTDTGHKETLNNPKRSTEHM